VKISSFRSGT